jgi:hypothetical protein
MLQWMERVFSKDIPRGLDEKGGLNAYLSGVCFRFCGALPSNFKQGNINF